MQIEFAYCMDKRRVSAGKRHIEQNLKLNVELGLMSRNRFKLTVSVSTDRRLTKTRVSA